MSAPRSVVCLFAAVLAAAPGCFVGDELNKSAALAEGGAKAAEAAAGKPAGKPAAAATTASAADAKKPAAPSGPSWWETAVSLSSEENTATDIVACKLGSKLEFMQKDDCLTRGGVPE
jgi:hypothetical protein